MGEFFILFIIYSYVFVFSCGCKELPVRTIIETEDGVFLFEVPPALCVARS